MQHLHVAS